ncbi:lipid II flippase family protein [Jhaorihella thermophila]
MPCGLLSALAWSSRFIPPEFFISFYFALLHFEHRASISQLSGLVNSVGTVLLTFYVEPQISRGIDEKREDAENRAYR